MGHQYLHPPHLFRESMRFEVSREETEHIKQSLQCQCGRANCASENSCLLSSTLHTDMEQDRLTEAEDSFNLMTDCDLDFPPILDCSQLKSTECADGGVMPPTRKRTFAQVVSKDSVCDDAKQNCCDETECGPKSELQETTERSPNTELESDDGMSSGEKHTVKHDGRYELLLDFAIKRGYSESNFEKVISRCGLACGKDLLLRELIRNSSESENLEMKCLDDGSERNMESEDESRMEVSMVPDDRPAEDVEEVKNGEESEDADNNLRDIIIDGSNVAMSHGQKGVFSCRGIQLAVDWFRDRGHRNIIVFVPLWRKETPHPDRPMSDQHQLLKLEEEGIVKFTPSRRVNGHRVVCYDDRYILKEAAHTQGIVVSNDNYRDLHKESEAFRTVVDERLLMYIFVNDRFIPPEDPLGRIGPTLDNFLRKQPSNGQTMRTECPYKHRCTYGTKCKYSHPWRGTTPHKMVSEGLKEQATKEMQKRRAEAMELKETSSGGRTKLARTPSRAHSQHRPTEKNSSVPLSRVPQESHTDTNSPSKSPAPSSGARDSHYLREHRKNLEKELARASLENSGPTNENTPLYNMWGSDSVNQHEDGFNGILVFSQERRPCTPPHVPSPYSNESQLVSGHLQLAKKLSDKASGSSFFAPEYLEPQRNQSGSPPHDAEQSDRPLFEGIYYYNRQSLLPDYHHHHHYGHNRVPQYTNTATVPWISEAPCGTTDTLTSGPCHSPCLPPPQYPSSGRGPPAQGSPVPVGHIKQRQYPNLSRQPGSYQIPHSPHPQTPKGLISSQDSATPVSSVGSPHWGEGPMYPNQTFTSFHYPQSPRYPSPPPPPAFSPPAGSSPSPWQANTPPPPLGPPTHPPPVASRTGPPAQPGCVDSIPPMAVTDTRSLLYLQLCDVFAQHVVQAVMTKYPEERNFLNLYAYILTELSQWSDV